MPIDKLVQRVARARGFSVAVLAPPALFRMPPALPSKIHRKWDAAFLEATTRQLALYGRDWAGVWLTPDERRLADGAPAGDDPAGGPDADPDADEDVGDS